MPGIQDHAVAVGNDELHMRPFDEIDALILSQIVYMPMEGFLDHGERATLQELWRFLQETYPDGLGDSFQQKRLRLTEACAMTPRYQNWVIHHYENTVDPEREMQFGVCSFELPQGKTFIAFRGTDWSLAGWKEDLNMSFMTVPSQREAVEYVERIAALNGDALLLGGHSKGGNLSVYAGAKVSGSTQERIHRVYCFDGPGVDKETMDSLEYIMLSQRIESFLPQSSIVGMLLYYHPVYTVVKSGSRGILQHDAMTWHVEDGRFVTLQDVGFSGKLTDHTLHDWLKKVDKDSRRLLVDTLYEVLDAAQEPTMDELVQNWQQSVRRIWSAMKEIEPEARRNVLRILTQLFHASATGAIQTLLPHVKLGRDEGEPTEEFDDRGLFYATAPKTPPNSGEAPSPAPLV